MRHTGNVFLNDRMMYETISYEECLAGEADPCSWVPEESVYKWYTVQDGDETVLYANFQGKNPNEENVEILVRRNCFMPSEEGIGYITVSGFVITKGATTWAPPAAYQDGLIGPHWSRGCINSAVEYNQEGALRYSVVSHGKSFEKSVEARQNYTLEVEQMGRCIENGEKPHITEEFSVANAELLDMVLERIGY